MVRMSSVGAGGWQRLQTQPDPARTHVIATDSRPGGGPHAAHSSPSSVERQRRPPHLEHVCHGPVSKMASDAADVVCVNVHVWHGAVGGSAVKGSTLRPTTCSAGSTIRGRVGDPLLHAGTNPPRGGQTGGVRAEMTVTGPRTSTSIWSTTLSVMSAATTSSVSRSSGPVTRSCAPSASRWIFDSSALIGPPSEAVASRPRGVNRTGRPQEAATAKPLVPHGLHSAHLLASLAAHGPQQVADRQVRDWRLLPTLCLLAADPVYSPLQARSVCRRFVRLATADRRRARARDGRGEPCPPRGATAVRPLERAGCGPPPATRHRPLPGAGPRPRCA